MLCSGNGHGGEHKANTGSAGEHRNRLAAYLVLTRDVEVDVTGEMAGQGRQPSDEPGGTRCSPG